MGVSERNEKVTASERDKEGDGECLGRMEGDGALSEV